MTVALLAGCAPELNWREVRSGDGSATAMFPCKPDRHDRNVALAGTREAMSLLVCSAGGSMFALADVRLDEPAAVGPALEALRAAMVDNLGAAQAEASAWSVKGMTPNERAGRLAASGRRPDGAAVRQEAVFFTDGLRVYQASVIAPRMDRDATESFFSGLRIAAMEQSR